MSQKAQYILGKRVARGGMAEIFLAKAIGEDGFQRICAVKRILPQYASEKEFVEMFRDEAHIGKRLQHANIVQVYDFKEVESSWAIIMEFIDGSDLRSILMSCEGARNKLSVAMICYLIAEAARGLHYAHTKIDDVTGKALNIVHRDISPQNILISFEGEVKVTDFGIADAESTHKSSETKPGVVKGKYSYMSPEQLAAKELDARSDVFSLSIVMWECLAMRRLFHGESDLQVIKKVQDCEIPVNLKSLNSEVDDDLMLILNKGLSKDRKSRHQTALALEKDLRKYLNTKYPDFNPAELSSFLKQLLKVRRQELTDEIRKTLVTQVNEAPISAGSNVGTGERKSIDLAIPRLENDGILDGGMLLKIDNAKSLSNAFIPKRSSHGQPISKAPSSHSLYTGYKTGVMRFNKREKTQSKIYSTMAASVAVLVFAVFTYTFFKDQVDLKALYKNTSQNIYLDTFPQRVKVFVNRKPIHSGKYLNTPFKIPVDPGSHEVQIEREGYIKQTHNVSIKEKNDFKLDKIVLKQDPSLNFSSVRIEHSDALQALTVVVNDGSTVRKTPFAVADLILGKEVNIDVFPNFPNTDASFRCKITPRSTSPDRPMILKIELETKNKYSCSF